MSKVEIHPMIYKRVKEFADSQHRSMRAVVEQALINDVGVEGIPLDKIYGKEQDNDKQNGGEE